MLTGHYNDLETDGLIIDAPDQTVVIGKLIVAQVRVPLIVKRVGKLIIDHYLPHSFWGDTANFRCSHIHINRFHPSDIQQRFAYEQYHQDLIFQAYATKANGWEVDPNGLIEDIIIHDIQVRSALTQVNGIMLSEVCEYRGFQLGTHNLNIQIEAPYWLSANSLADSVIGGNQVCVGSLSGTYTPDVRIKDVKGSLFESARNVMCNV